MDGRRRRLAVAGWLLVLLLGASCGSGASESSEAAEISAPSTSVAETTAAPTSTAIEPEATTTTTGPVGPPAPDFTLDLYGGGTFVLSEQTTPVLMVFWAEW